MQKVMNKMLTGMMVLIAVGNILDCYHGTVNIGTGLVLVLCGFVFGLDIAMWTLRKEIEG